MEEIASWKQRDGFELTRAEQARVEGMHWTLDDMFVEPCARRVGHQERRKALGLLEALSAQHRLLLVSADFGQGKSLLALKAAQSLAEAWLAKPQSSSAPMPIFVRAAEVIHARDYQLNDVLGRAQGALFQAALPEHRSVRDPVFKQLTDDSSCLFLIDGLDEAALRDEELEAFVRELDQSLSRRHRAIIFLRPGLLSTIDGLAGLCRVEILGFRAPEIRHWLKRWEAAGGAALSYEDLKAAKLLSSWRGRPSCCV